MKTAKAQDEETVFKAARGKRLTGYRQRDPRRLWGFLGGKCRRKGPCSGDNLPREVIFRNREREFGQVKTEGGFIVLREPYKKYERVFGSFINRKGKSITRNKKNKKGKESHK